MMMREARLSEQNQYIRFLSLNAPSKECSIPSIVDPNSIVTCEILVDSVTDTWDDVQIVDRVDINAQESGGRRAVARFGRPTKLRFTWDPSLSSDTLRIGYENLPVDASQPNDIPNLPEDFHDCLTYRSAAILTETILGKSPGPVFMDMMGRIERQWSQWCGRDAEERPIQRPGFGSIDTDDPMEFFVF